MKKLTAFLLILALALSLSCAAYADGDKLPAPEPDESSMFGVDKNINMATLDNYLGRDDVVYRDVRMLFDPADYAAIGGNADLASTVEGFRIVPYPYLATLSALPVEGAYDAETLYTLTWNEDGSIASAEPNYEESLLVLEDCFPRFLRDSLLGLGDTMPATIRRMTGATADRYRLEDRGYLREGCKADITILDEDRLKVDESKPDFKPEGIEYVFINGRKVVDKGNFVSGKAGQLILRKGFNE